MVQLLLVIILLSETVQSLDQMFQKYQLNSGYKTDLCCTDRPDLIITKVRSSLECALNCLRYDGISYSLNDIPSPPYLYPNISHQQIGPNLFNVAMHNILFNTSLPTNFPNLFAKPAVGLCYGFNYFKLGSRECQLFGVRELYNTTNSSNICTFYQRFDPPSPTDCNDIPEPANSSNNGGIYWIRLNAFIYPVYCYFEDTGDKYLVFQRRFDGLVEFYRNWLEYENGFGNLNGEFWLGNRLISEYTARSKNFTLKIIAVAFDMTRVHSYLYDFKLASADKKYKIMFSSSGGNYTCVEYADMAFSTWDNDNDIVSYNCAQKYRGAWWYRDCHVCNLNGHYYSGGYHSSTFADGIDWFAFRGFHESMKMTWMTIKSV